MEVGREDLTTASMTVDLERRERERNSLIAQDESCPSWKMPEVVSRVEPCDCYCVGCPNYWVRRLGFEQK